MTDALAVLQLMLSHLDRCAGPEADHSFRIRSHQHRVISTAGMSEDEQWKKVEQDYESTVQLLTDRWGVPLVTEKAINGISEDFFAAAIAFPPDLAGSEDAVEVSQTGDSLRRELRRYDRFNAWRLGDEVAYVALEHADNTRVVSLIVGALKS